jgi:hypothetical protein
MTSTPMSRMRVTMDLVAPQQPFDCIILLRDGFVKPRTVTDQKVYPPNLFRGTWQAASGCPRTGPRGNVASA